MFLTSTLQNLSCSFEVNNNEVSGIDYPRPVLERFIFPDKLDLSGKNDKTPVGNFNRKPPSDTVSKPSNPLPKKFKEYRCNFRNYHIPQLKISRLPKIKSSIQISKKSGQ